MNLNKAFRPVADFVARWTGRPVSFIVCVAIVVVWVITGPLFHFSDTWQLVINTGTTIVTFLMVFLIQNTQNRDSMALQAKLDELIRVGKSNNSFIGVEHLTDSELEALVRECEEKVKARGASGSERLAAITIRQNDSPALTKARQAAKARSAKRPITAKIKRG